MSTSNLWSCWQKGHMYVLTFGSQFWDCQQWQSFLHSAAHMTRQLAHQRPCPQSSAGRLRKDLNGMAFVHGSGTLLICCLPEITETSACVRFMQILQLHNHMGCSLDPNSCFLIQRGLKTLPLRVRQVSSNALALAAFLQQQPQVMSLSQPHKVAAMPLTVHARIMRPTCWTDVQKSKRDLSCAPILAEDLISANSFHCAMDAGCRQITG